MLRIYQTKYFYYEIAKKHGNSNARKVAVLELSNVVYSVVLLTKILTCNLDKSSAMASSTRNNPKYIYDLPYFARMELCRILDQNDKWEELGEIYCY